MPKGRPPSSSKSARERKGLVGLGERSPPERLEHHREVVLRPLERLTQRLARQVGQVVVHLHRLYSDGESQDAVCDDRALDLAGTAEDAGGPAVPPSVPPGLRRRVPDKVPAPGQPGQLEDRLLRPRQQDLVRRRLRADGLPRVEPPDGLDRAGAHRLQQQPRRAQRGTRRLGPRRAPRGTAGSDADASRERPGVVRRTCSVRTAACTWRRSTRPSSPRSCGRSGRAHRGRRSRTSRRTPLANVNGRRIRPGVSVSISSAASPRCRLSGVPVRTRTRSRVAQMSVAGPHLLAVDDDLVAFEHPRVRRAARSLPASGSENA